MHIPDALLEPKVAAIAGAVGAAGLLYALRKLERQLGRADDRADGHDVGVRVRRRRW